MWRCGLGPARQVSVVLKEIEEKYTEKNYSLQMSIFIEKTMLHLWNNKQINTGSTCGNV